MASIRKNVAGIALGLVASASLSQPHSNPNAIVHPDGSRTVLRGQQLPEDIERQERWCALHGGRSITNDGDVTVGAKTIDAIICTPLDPSVPGFSGAYILKEGPTDKISPDAVYEIAPPMDPNRLPALREQAVPQ